MFATETIHPTYYIRPYFNYHVLSVLSQTLVPRTRDVQVVLTYHVTSNLLADITRTYILSELLPFELYNVAADIFA